MATHLSNLSRRNTSLVKSLVVDEKLLPLFEEIVENCKSLQHLNLGSLKCKFHQNGSIYYQDESINDLFETSREEDEESDDGGEDFLINPQDIARNLYQLKRLRVNAGVQLEKRSSAPPTLDELMKLEELSLCPLRVNLRCARDRDEWNLRILGQSSKELRILDLRGCYLKIMSLGWLKTEKLEALHLYYQVPAASVLYRWINTLKYLTLAKVSTKYKTYRSLGPEKPGEELDACLMALASAKQESQLLQLDLLESDCSLNSLKILLNNCNKISYIDTRKCDELAQKFQVQCTSRDQILKLITLVSTDGA